MTDNNIKDSLVDLLRDIGIVSGRTVFVHSDLFRFMDIAREVGPKYLPKLILDCLLGAVGDCGTVVMPSFTTDCARKGLPFDLYHTPSDSGSLVEYLRCQSNTVRSLHPVNSVIAFGCLAESLTKDVSLGSYSWDSPFDRMASEDTVVLCMGTTNNLSNSFSHYAETKSGLPYLYNKMLDYIPVSIDGVVVVKDFYMTVRYLDYDIKPDRTRHDETIRKSCLMHFAKWGDGGLSTIKLADYLGLLKSCLRKDPFFLLAHSPSFRKRERPDDGAVIGLT